MQYSLTNLNAFFLLLSIGYSLYYYVNDNKEEKELKDINNSPIQLISQIKGFFYINPVLSISLAITIFSFLGVPPLVGFFAKQMVLSAALDSGYVFLALVAILTSVISAVYYLNIINQVFFDKPEYKINPEIEGLTMHVTISEINKVPKLFTISEEVHYTYKNIMIASYLTISIAILTLIITGFIFMPSD
jgi:NADH-ubiquinone oxidoreductase chain 2